MVFFDDQAERLPLERAWKANAGLVLFGAERLFGENRLSLEQDEAWNDPMPARFMFWVARDELLLPRPPARVGADLLAKLAAGLTALLERAAAGG